MDCREASAWRHALHTGVQVSILTGLGEWNNSEKEFFEHFKWRHTSFGRKPERR